MISVRLLSRRYSAAAVGKVECMYNFDIFVIKTLVLTISPSKLIEYQSWENITMPKT